MCPTNRKLPRVFNCECRYGFLHAHGCDHDHADQYTHGTQDRSQAEGFAGEEISEQHGHYRIYIRVGPDLGGRFVMNEPDVGGDGDDGARGRSGRAMRATLRAPGDRSNCRSGHRLGGGQQEYLDRWLHPERALGVFGSVECRP